MLGWTLGGYPSPNLEVVAEIGSAPGGGEVADLEGAMVRVAQRRFGKELAPHVVPAWREYSRAFSEFPFHGGLVYSALVSALATGSPVKGAMAMLAFGLGTLPNLLLAGYVFARFRGFAQAPAVRLASGLLVLGFGVVGLWRAATFPAS